MIAGDGRPLRFLALVSGGWVAARVGFAWYATGSLPQAVREILPIPHDASAALTPPMRLTPPVQLTPRPSLIGVRARRVAAIVGPRPVVMASAKLADPRRVQLAWLAMTQFAGALRDDRADAVGTAPPPRSDDTATLIRAASPSRLSVSSWFIARGGTGVGATSLSPQLGGTQGGVRIDYALTRGIAATARVAAPAAGAGRELSLGIAWRPAGVPLRFVAEQRLALDGGRSGPALGVSGGVSELRLPAGFRLEGYGQAGAILRGGIERYVDGSVRAARSVTELAGITLEVGGGAWGGAQRGVARLDIGPSVGAQVPLSDRRVRVALDCGIM